MYYYVYILESLAYPEKYYAGYTVDIKKRLAKHNEGGSTYTSLNKPWKIKTAIAFDEKEKAQRFEKYIKSHSGRSFVKKHF